MNAFGSVFSHMGGRCAVKSFQRGLGLAPAIDYGKLDIGMPTTSSPGPSSSGDMSIPVLGDLTSFFNIADRGMNLFAQYNLAKTGNLKITEPGGKGTPSLTPGSVGASPLGVSTSVLAVGGLAIGALVLYMVLK